MLIANHQEMYSRALESVLGPRGYAVLRAYTGAQAIERCRATPPDIIILDVDLPDMDGLEVCRTLRDDPAVSACTPILMTRMRHTTRQDRIDAAAAGAWDYIGSAIDDEELPLRLDTYMRAKFEFDRSREEGLVDSGTGLYNVRGLSRRAQELGALAFRHREPFACVVFSARAEHPEDEAERREIATTLARLAGELNRKGRVSDAAGIIGPTEIAVVAQGTDAEGAVRLAERIAGELHAATAGRRVSVVAGLDAVTNYREAPLEPSEMLARASRAMRGANSKPGSWIHRFEEDVATPRSHS